jgi:hypothetical protein
MIIVAKSINIFMENISAKVKPIPEGYHTITPFLVVDNASGFIKFFKKHFMLNSPI